VAQDLIGSKSRLPDGGRPRWDTIDTERSRFVSRFRFRDYRLHSRSAHGAWLTDSIGPDTTSDQSESILELIEILGAGALGCSHQDGGRSPGILERVMMSELHL
jgi:hypothetical protein